jgi:hypothetical protein
MGNSVQKLVLAGSLLAGLAGCQAYHYSEKKLYGPGERASETDAPHVSVEMANSAQFRAVPLQIQHAFTLDYGDAAVTSVQMLPTGTGGMFYKIAYIENGTPGQAVYHTDGTPAAADSGVVVLPDPSEVKLPPVPAELPGVPTTEPIAHPTVPATKDFQ